MSTPHENQPIEAHLGDGGHIIVTFADSVCRNAAADLIVEILVLGDGSEDDLERAIRSAVDVRGFSCSTSPGQHPTLVVVGRA